MGADDSRIVGPVTAAETQRESVARLEITPEMLEAGANVIEDWGSVSSPDHLASQVFQAMIDEALRRILAAPPAPKVAKKKKK